MLNNLNQKAFTLVEMLVALAVSSIMIMATYASYDIVAQQFKKNKDIAELHTSGRAILRMVERDIRMAGFSFRDRDANLVFGEILDKDALKLTDSGTDACCDSITVQYDYYDEEYKTVERQEIIYDSSKYKDRNRLYKRINILGKDGELYTSKKIGKREVMADFIEDFQLVNIDNSSRLYAGMEGVGGIRMYDPVEKKGVGGFDSINISALAFGPDGLLYSGFRPRYRIWIDDPVSKRGLGFFPSRFRVSALAFGPDGLLYSGSEFNGGIVIHDPVEKKEVGFIPGGANIDALAFGPNGLLYSGNESSRIISIYDPVAKKEVGFIRGGYNVSVLAFGPDELLYSGSDRGIGATGRVYDPVAKKEVGAFGLNSPSAFAFGPDGLLYVGNDRRADLSIWDPVRKRFVGHFRSIDVRMPISAIAIKSKKTGQEALVKIHLVIRSRKEHSRIDKTYTKKSYDIGNYKLNKRDKYKHDSFSSTVLARNLVL